MATLRFKAKNGLDANTQTIVNLATPVNATDAATKGYADTKLSGTGGSISGLLTVGTAISGSDNYLTLANPGIGWANGFQFTRGTDAVGIKAIETGTDNTMYELWMADNPDGGDMMQWRMTDWQSPNGLTVPLQTTGKYNRFVGTLHSFYGSIQQSSSFFTTCNLNATNGADTQLVINDVSKLRTVGTTVSITALNTAGYTGGDGDVFWIKLVSSSTFSWGYGAPSGTATTTGISLSLTAITLANGIVVTFSAISGTLGDTFVARVWKTPSNSLGNTTISGTLAMSNNRITNVANPVNAQDVVTKSYADALTITGNGYQMTQIAQIALSTTPPLTFTGIPTWVKRITIQFVGAKLSASDDILVQLGISTGFPATTYASNSGAAASAGTWSIASSTTGFIYFMGNTARISHGVMVLTKTTGNTWIAYHTHATTGSVVSGAGAGSVTLSAILTQLKIVSTTTNTFTAGSVSLIYEG